MNGEEGEGEVIIAAETAMPASNTRVVPWKIRYPALICSCLLGFAGYLVFDLCATLQGHLMTSLDVSEETYSALYIVYPWATCLVALVAGFIIDYTSIRRCTMIFCAFPFFGQIFISFGVQCNQFSLMVIGRILFSIGLGGICVIQNTICNKYFRGADLATAFAATLSMNKLGSFATSLVMGSSCYGHQKHCTPSGFFWGGMAITLLSVLAGVAFCVLDRRAEAKKVVVSASKKSHKFNWKDLKDFPAIYWVLCAICGCYYISIFTLMPMLIGVFESDTYTMMISGWNCLVIILCAPIFGLLLDYFGKRIIVLAVSIAIMFPFDLLLNIIRWELFTYTFVPGASYSAVAITLLPCICMVVRDEAVGVANGIATAIQMVCFGIAELTVKYPVSNEKIDHNFIVFVACFMALGFLLTIVANILDKKQFDGFINNFRPLKGRKEETENVDTRSEDNEEEAKEDNNQSTPLLKA